MKMKDLDRFLAEKVMGWSVIGVPVISGALCRAIYKALEEDDA